MRSARLRRARRRDHASGELMLAAMVDMMINILIFLLTLYGTTPIELPKGESLALASSAAREPVKLAVTVAVTTASVYVDNVSVLPLDRASGVPRLPPAAVVDGRIAPLADALLALIDEARAPGPDGQPVEPELLLQVDKAVPWSVLGAVMHTAEAVGYPRARFVVRSSDEAR